MRAALREYLMKRAANDESRRKDAPLLYELAIEFPKAPAAPHLLYRYAFLTQDPERPSSFVFEKVWTDYPKSRHVVGARYNYILRSMDVSDEAFRMKTYRDFIRDFPNETYKHEFLVETENQIRAEPYIWQQVEEARKKAKSDNFSYTLDIPQEVTLEDLKGE